MKKITDFDKNIFLGIFLTGRNRPRNLGWARIHPAQSPLEQWNVNYNSRSTVRQWNQHGEEEEGRREMRGKQTWRRLTCCWRLLTGERLGRWSAFLLLLCVFLFCSVLLCFCFFSGSSSPRFCLLLLLSSSISNGGCCRWRSDGGSSLRWRAVSAAVFLSVQRCRLLLLQGCCSRGRKMVRG